MFYRPISVTAVVKNAFRFICLRRVWTGSKTFLLAGPPILITKIRSSSISWPAKMHWISEQRSVQIKRQKDASFQARPVPRFGTSLGPLAIGVASVKKRMFCKSFLILTVLCGSDFFLAFVTPGGWMFLNKVYGTRRTIFTVKLRIAAAKAFNTLI